MLLKQCTLLFIFISFHLFPVNIFAQEKITISGYIADSATGEQLSGATVFIPEFNLGRTSNNYGFYSLTVPQKKLTIVCRFVGFDTQILKLNILKDTVINIFLESNNDIGEVEVKAFSGEDFLRSAAMGTHRLSAKQIEKIPAVLGESDLIKTIQLLPGVSFANEGQTGFSVRGGNPDQTLIQLDGVPVYNVNHLWGFMSAFNNDAINDAKLYKGNLPARFGGRLSSVLDVSMKEGNLKKRTGTFSLSPIAGRFTLEGPIVKDKASFMFSARKTWADLLLLAAQKLEGEGEQVLTYGFWDINAKTNWNINRNNRVYMSFYTGRDAFVMEDGGSYYSDYVKFGYNWQNLTGVLRWNHIFSPKLFANFSAYNSRFKQEYINKFDKKGDEVYKGSNNLNDWTVKGDFDWFAISNTKFMFGYQFSIQKFSPEIISYKSDSVSFVLNKDIFTQNIISEIYFESDISISEKLKGNFGLRGGVMLTNNKTYPSLRPRISLRYLFTDKFSGKISYSRMVQYLHLLQNTTLGIPTELWVSSTDKIKPGNSNLYSVGLFFSPTSSYKFSSEIYYSQLHNVIRYKPGTMALKEQGDNWDDFVATGNGESFGLELMAEKISGDITGWISYTLSKSIRQYNEINFGNPFPFAYDRRHQININANYFLGEKNKKGRIIRHELSANFNYASGNYLTFAEQKYQGILLPLMENPHGENNWFLSRSLLNEINNYQMPAFHNLNLSYRIERKSVDKTILWNFSVYNVYNRFNPWYYYKKGDSLKMITMFPIIPSVSFTYKW